MARGPQPIGMTVKRNASGSKEGGEMRVGKLEKENTHEKVKSIFA